MRNWTRLVQDRLAQEGVSVVDAEQVEGIREIAAHVEDAYRSARTAGQSETDAERAALDQLSDMGPLADALTRRARTAPARAHRTRQLLMVLGPRVLADVRYSLRCLYRSPLFAAVAMTSLALGIGFNTALFSIVDALLFRPLPVERPDRLVNVYVSNDEGRYATSSYPDYLDLLSRSQTLTGLAGFSESVDLINRGDHPRLALGEVVTGNYFPLLGVRAELGRTLMPDDDRPGAPRVAAIGDRFWRQEFGADPTTVGRTLRIHGQAYTIVGVIPGAFTGMLPMVADELWTPMAQVADVEPAGLIDVIPSPTGTTRLERRGDRWIFLKGRLRSDATSERAEAELQVRMAQLDVAYPQTNKGRRVTVVPTTRVRIHPEVDRLLVPVAAGLAAIVGMVLLVACGNVASLLLARGSGRQREVAIRLAIGASRGRLVQQLLTESLVLAGAGAVLGTFFAWIVTRLATALSLPLPVPLTLAIHLDARVLWFTAGITALAGLVAGLAPALQATRPRLVGGLKGDAPVLRAAGRRWTLADGLVAGQLAGTTVLLVAAGLLTHSLMASEHASVGFRTEGLAAVGTDLKMLGYSADRSRVFFDQAVARVRALPGVTSAALAGDRLPFDLNHSESTIFLPDRQSAGDHGVSIDETHVSAEYFSTLGVPILRGRNFMPTDTPASPGVVIINETMARRFWPHVDPIGQRVRTQAIDGHEFRVVGVVADYTVSLVGEPPTPYLHFAYTQRPDTGAIIVARTQGEAGALLEDMRRAVHGLDPDVVLLDNQTMDAQIGVMLLPAKVGAVAGIATGFVAMALAAVGLYGVMACAVTRRTREIGIRLALGVPRSAVIGLVLRQGLSVAAPGIVAGMLLALGVAMALATTLYHVGALDPLAWGTAFGVVATASTLANLLPARRASRVDPLIALRTD
jgi:predicted permease